MFVGAKVWLIRYLPKIVSLKVGGKPLLRLFYDKKSKKFLLLFCSVFDLC